ncbi:MDR family MFS transporter [Tersicoccus mangrovi]|uniref:MDR family MFS transporter n=1 Tax=Tersicoccus mangrovi TaxID=3121635 RepID=UPI003A7F62C1
MPSALPEDPAPRTGRTQVVCEPDPQSGVQPIVPASVDTAVAQPGSRSTGSTPAEVERIPAGGVAVIVTMLVAAFVVILNETILNVALPRMMVDLGVNATTVQWLSTGFLLTMAVVIPITGFVLQRFSTRAVFGTAMGLFSAGTLLAALAPGFGVLLVARVIQAGGTAMMMPLLMTTILTLVPLSRRGAVMGNLSIVISVAPALGPTVSGLILQAFSWRFVFVFVLPIALAALAYGVWKLTNVNEGGDQRFDIVSVILSVPGFGGLVYGLSHIGEGQGGSVDPVAIAVIVGAVVVLAVFVARQLQLQRRDRPFLDLRTFRFPMFSISVAIMCIAMAVLLGSAIILPIYLQTVLGLPAIVTGLVVLPGGLLMGVMGPIVGRLFDRLGPQPLTVTGSALLVVVLWLFSRMDTTTPVWAVVVLYLVLTLGLALLFTPCFTGGLNPLPPHLYSHGSAILSTLQQVAGAAGTAVLVSIMSAAAVTTTTAAGTRVDLVPGMHVAFFVAAIGALGAVVLSLFTRREASAAGGHGGH